MRRADPLLIFLTFLVLIYEAFALPVISDTSPDEPIVIPPREPFSQIVYVNDLPPGQTVTYDFVKGASVYVSSSKDEGAELYEENIHIHVPDVEGVSRKMTEAGKEVNSETGVKRAAFGPTYNRISISNRNTEKAELKNPGIIYFLLVSDGTHLSTVYESTSERRNIYVKSEHIDTRYITVLNPTGAIKITDIHRIDGLTTLTVTAGGVEETENLNYTIHNIGKDDSQSKAPLVVVEPVVTFRKQFSIFPSDFEFTVKAVDSPTGDVVIPMNWSDWSVGMSSNYMLRNETNSFKYIFNASLENSQFDVQMFGELDASSSLSLSYDGYDGAGTEILSKRHLERLDKNTKGQTLTVEYKRGETDTTKGVLVRVHCSQYSSLPLIYTVFSAVGLRYLFL
ncbi:unnamed protein product [Caenorhabditis sp. 36 PRJEB53466]|nr:unnamed protein product [Caenorhabditis sp. 36 PRJEB53466]